MYLGIPLRNARGVSPRCVSLDLTKLPMSTLGRSVNQPSLWGDGAKICRDDLRRERDDTVPSFTPAIRRGAQDGSLVYQQATGHFSGARRVIVTGRNRRASRTKMRDAPCRALTPKTLPSLKCPPRQRDGRPRGTKQRVLTLRIRLLAQHQVDERIRHVVQLAHALWVELGGGVVGQPDGVDGRVDERLRGHYLVELPVQVLADRPHTPGQARLLAQHRPQKHVRHREHAYEGHQDRRRGLHRHGFAPMPTHRSDSRLGRAATDWLRSASPLGRRGHRNAELRNRTAVPPPSAPSRAPLRSPSRSLLLLSLSLPSALALCLALSFSH